MRPSSPSEPQQQNATTLRQNHVQNEKMMPKISGLLVRVSVSAALLTALIFASACARSPQSQQSAATPSQKAAAPIHDLSGTWDPEAGPGGAVQADGAKNYPSDGKHALPFTPLGEQTFKAHKPGFGITQVPVALANDPMDICDPQGFPRIVLHNFRTSEIVQTANQVLILYEFNKIWRVIWTDGRPLPADPEPRWFGYSVGKWDDDTTFVAQTIGTDDRTWLDNAGRPHSGDLHVEERYHRVDPEHLEMSVTIDDPKMYTQPWVALDKLILKLQPAGFDIREMQCSPSETAKYNKEMGLPAARTK